MSLDGLADLALHRVELHRPHHSVLLGLDAHQEEPLLCLVCSVVDDLAANQRGMSLKHLNRLGIPLHRPVIHYSLCDNTDSVEIDPLPEYDVIWHGMALHLALHLNVEYLELSSGF